MIENAYVDDSYSMREEEDSDMEFCEDGYLNAMSVAPKSLDDYLDSKRGFHDYGDY